MTRTPLATLLPLSTLYAASMSDSLPLVHEPITTWSIFILRLASELSVSVFSGRCGLATVCSSASRSIVSSRSYSASASAYTRSNAVPHDTAVYASVASSTGNMPFFAPASIAMLQTVKRSSMPSALTFPPNSNDA